MYRPQQSRTEKYGTIALVVALHAGLAAFVLANGGIAVVTGEKPVLDTFDVTLPPPPEEPPPEPPEPPPTVEEVVPDFETPEEEGEAAPEQVESQATPVVRPENTPPIPVPPTITSATEAGDGSEATQGAGEVDDGGTGAGGEGDGTGAGGSGDGTGGGGTGGEETTPKLIKSTQVVINDFPRDLRRQYQTGSSMLMVVLVTAQGYSRNCDIRQGSGSTELDAAVCARVERQVRWEPARDARGRPFDRLFGYQIAPPRR